MPSITAGASPTPQHGGWWRRMGAAATGLMPAALGQTPHKPPGQIPCQQKELRNLHMSASARFASCSLLHRLPERCLLAFATAALVEEMLPRLQCPASAPLAFVVLLVSEQLLVCSSRCMPTLQSIESCCQ